MTKVQLLDDAAIFDVYGIQQLITTPNLPLDDAERFEAEQRLTEIWELYVDAAKARIRAEAVFCGIELDPANLSMEAMLSKVRDLVMSDINNQGVTGQPINVFQSIMKANAVAGNLSDAEMKHFGVGQDQQEGPPDPEVDPEWFTKAKGRMWDNPKWKEIAEAFMRLEGAVSHNDMIQSIDYLNSLQHNSFHLLIDLQTGRMLSGESEGDNYGDDQLARRNLQDTLDLIHDSAQAFEYADKMSSPIRKILLKNKSYFA